MLRSSEAGGSSSQESPRSLHSLLRVKNEKAGQSLNIRLIPNHDRNGRNLRFATVDETGARATMTGSLVSPQFPRGAN